MHRRFVVLLIYEYQYRSLFQRYLTRPYHYGEFENGIMEFEIIDSSKVNDEHYRFIVIETYFDGYKAQTPVDVKKLGDRWRIVIKDDVSEGYSSRSDVTFNRCSS